ncbi:transcription-repair coupling factor [Patulibacter sp. SYSU D01012]|uniref:transcription-repair coupling factor n=1 Tax=Patulibacter sp. SYSU D01012 TaxID=2817381 RepID=UPI001B3016CF|nr:transcription-repair coupling factor [Patulibacter sp. SYSU D01012]
MSSLRPLLRHLADEPTGARIAREGGRVFVATSMRPFVVAGALDGVDGAIGLGRPALVVAADDKAARELARDLRAWLHPRPVRFYPSRGVAYESQLAPPPHLVGMRVAALDALLAHADGTSVEDEPPVVVASAAALSETVPDPALRPRGFCLKVGDLLDLDEVAGDLVGCGYERVDQVADRGQFAIRGGILDVFPATEDNPVRVDLFDIEIESIRAFSVYTQRSLDALPQVDVAPAAELAEEHRGSAEIAVSIQKSSEGDERPDVADLLPVDRFGPFLDLVPQDAVVVLVADEEIAPALNDQWEDVTAAFHDTDAGHLYIRPEDVLKELEGRAELRIASLLQDQDLQLHGQSGDLAARNLTAAETELEKLLRSGYRTVVTWRRQGDGDRAAYNLSRVRAQWVGEGDFDRSRAGFVVAELRHGFIAPGMELAVLPDHRLMRRRKSEADDESRRRTSRRGALRSFADLRTGDYVVHEDHGIARFNGFDTKTVGGVTRDYLKLQYAGDDKVFVPVDQLAKITRYVTGGSGTPTLSKLGGKGWELIKTRARKAAHEMAGELLNLYAERRARRGHRFPPDGELVEEFESKFPYKETVDQLDAIDAVKADMESERPMDRLICGDVGFGKTEVALRAAVKAAADGKQVLILAPTTILAQQHYGNFAERMRDLPITVDHVSRFRSAAEQRQVVQAFNAGQVDVMIGTHRILGRDVQGKDLGLIVVDEEQRFGVKQKELLRQLKLRVDVIAMSATPIPRTLQMSLAGLRDISTIETAPEGRRPVKTYVGEYDEQLVRQALRREKERGGQSFFLHNRVETIDETASRLRGLCPDMTFEVAHGQMTDQQLEDHMMRFLRGEADVLVATSIIESGIDIPQANTLIVDRSDLFGLSQLYQIRGRVGRGRDRGYAYLLYPSAAALTEDAMHRLTALADYTELGSGFQIAMRDLELRGAGNLLGDEQSGHVAALGFELYLSMLEEAVAEREREAGESGDDDRRDPVRMDAQVSAYVPADYVPYEQAKVDVHRRIASAVDVAELEELRGELEDRFGALPEPLSNLVELQRARIRFGEAGATVVSLRGTKLTITPIELDPEGRARLAEEVPGAKYEGGHSRITVTVPKEGPERLEAVVAAAEGVRAAALSVAPV